ncbi:MAG: DUF3459 domain-containing protein [Steroidobacteraceae bacterium]
MPWTVTKPLAGFTIGDESWLPMDPRHRNNAVDVQEADPESVLNFTRTLLALRRETAALSKGDYVPLDGGEDVLSFERRSGDDRLWCVFNLGERAADCAAPAALTERLLQVGNVAMSTDRVRRRPRRADRARGRVSTIRQALAPGGR